MADVVALLEREKAKMSKERLFFRRPPYPMELLNKSYSERYELSTFAQYNGRKGSAIEHMSKFMDIMGLYAGDEDLCLCKFSKSLSDRAYTWYIGLRSGSIPTWDDMVDVLCSKYFHGEETVTLETLQSMKQRNGEYLLEFIKRFKDISLDFHDHF